jgi:hypothetical protein
MCRMQIFVFVWNRRAEEKVQRRLAPNGANKSQPCGRDITGNIIPSPSRGGLGWGWGFPCINYKEVGIGI